MGQEESSTSLPGMLIGAAVALFIVVAIAVFSLAGLITYIAMNMKAN
ncbi:MAG: hypothetical protein ABSG71_03630 [Thermodesulfobacteriota bacterium]|jgi:hypothetical protein